MERGAVAYVKEEGGTRSASLNNLALDMAPWCEVRNIVLKAEHLPGVLNSIADREFHRGVDWSDWRLRPEVGQRTTSVAIAFGKKGGGLLCAAYPDYS